MRVYMDLVLLLNFLVDFLLLMGTNRLSGFPAGYPRAALAAAIGSLYAGGCMLQGFSFLGNLLWRMVSLVLMAATAFGWNKSALRRGTVFVLLSMAMGGIAVGLGRGSFLLLVLAAAGLWGLCRISLWGGLGQKEFIPVELSWNTKKVALIALRDTGNLLRDPVTGEQVLVAGADVGWELLGLTRQQLADPMTTLTQMTQPGFRLVPYHSVGQPGGLMLTVRLKNAKIGKELKNPLVAFAPEVFGNAEGYRMLTGGAG